MKRLISGVAAAALIISFAARGAGDTQSTREEARRELFADGYESAAALYTKVLAAQPGDGDAWYGLVRAELGLHHSAKVYAAGQKALASAPESAGGQTAAGLALYRQGDLAAAEKCFRTALKTDSRYPGALRGLASILSLFSQYKSVRELRLKAWQYQPDDPELMLIHANTLNGPEHIAALAAILALIDPASEEARRLRVHIASDRALGDRKLRRLVSPYQASRIKLIELMDGPSNPRGLGVSLVLNQKQTVKLLLDTGASGIALSPRAAEKAGLQTIGGESSETKGIGDEKPQETMSYLASEIRAGDVAFANYPISVFRLAKSPDYDGLIGADVFQRFLVKIDFPALTLSLTPKQAAGRGEEPEDPPEPPAGFFRAFRFGDHLALPTRVNGGRPVLFLVDSGASNNFIDTETAKGHTSVNVDDRTTMRGVQGKVAKVSRADHISLAFAGFSQENADMVSFDMDKMSDSMGTAFGGILGMPALRSLIVTVDYGDGTVRLEYPGR